MSETKTPADLEQWRMERSRDKREEKAEQIIQDLIDKYRASANFFSPSAEAEELKQRLARILFLVEDRRSYQVELSELETFVNRAATDYIKKTYGSASEADGDFRLINKCINYLTMAIDGYVAEVDVARGESGRGEAVVIKLPKND